MLSVVSWNSQETAPRLTEHEVEVLFNFTYAISDTGDLNNGKYIGATQPLYWERLRGKD